jgi:hypothetical protein
MHERAVAIDERLAVGDLEPDAKLDRRGALLTEQGVGALPAHRIATA